MNGVQRSLNIKNSGFSFTFALQRFYFQRMKSKKSLSFFPPFQTPNRSTRPINSSSHHHPVPIHIRELGNFIDVDSRLDLPPLPPIRKANRRHLVPRYPYTRISILPLSPSEKRRSPPTKDARRACLQTG